MTTRLTRPPQDRPGPRHADPPPARLSSTARARARAAEDVRHRAERDARTHARALRRWRIQQFFAAVVPWLLLALVVVGLALLLAGCAAPPSYTGRDEIRASCASAAHAYTLAIERTRAGVMSAETFAAVDAGYDGVLATCRRVLVGEAVPVAADAARVAVWTAKTEAETGAVP